MKISIKRLKSLITEALIRESFSHGQELSWDEVVRLFPNAGNSFLDDPNDFDFFLDDGREWGGDEDDTLAKTHDLGGGQRFGLHAVPKSGALIKHTGGAETEGYYFNPATGDWGM